ncbi:MAG: BON domain-containing protein [Planctomycetia bacterium]|nr:BON domain-containing protein [Planctomycetia bacterium]
MRRYQKWLSLGLLTLTPHFALADELHSPAAKSAPAAQRKGSSNQELAEKVAKALRKAQLNQYEIDIDVRSGVVTLVGSIGKPAQRAAAEKAVGSVAGVTRVINRLEVAPTYHKGEVQQAAASMPRSPVGSSQYIRQAQSTRPSYGGIEPGPIAYSGAAPVPQPAPQYAPVNAYPVSSGGPGAYCPPNGPNNAWAGSAQSPNYGGVGYGSQQGAANYAGVGYGSQQAASAWPYAGPFYPYPQIPLGWRKASLEWDDGYWNLNFRSRTDHWWWYLNPQNW